jgi:hypothetical protein
MHERPYLHYKDDEYGLKCSLFPKAGSKNPYTPNLETRNSVFAVLGKAGQKRRLFDIFDKGIYPSTLLVIGSRLIDKKITWPWRFVIVEL